MNPIESGIFRDQDKCGQSELVSFPEINYRHHGYSKSSCNISHFIFLAASCITLGALERGKLFEVGSDQ